MHGEAYVKGGGGGAYTWSNRRVKEKVGLFAGGLFTGAYRRRNTVFHCQIHAIRAKIMQNTSRNISQYFCSSIQSNV